MVNACQPFVADGKLQLYTVDSLDRQSWTNWEAHPADRARKHEDYDRYIIEEVVAFIRGKNSSHEKLLTTGCSMGATMQQISSSPPEYLRCGHLDQRDFPVEHVYW
jgi:esterase/lipase superfamily enzyme